MRTVKKIVSALAVPILYFKISIIEVFKFTPVLQSKKLKAGSMHQPSCSFITDGEDVFGTYSTFFESSHQEPTPTAAAKFIIWPHFRFLLFHSHEMRNKSN